MARQARAAEPKAKAAFVLDCGDRADLVQDAFREGLAEACFTGRPAVAARLADIARKSQGAAASEARPAPWISPSRRDIAGGAAWRLLGGN